MDIGYNNKDVKCLLHFTAGESVVTGDCRMNLSGSAIKLICLIISSAVKRKRYKSLPLTSSHAI